MLSSYCRQCGVEMHITPHMFRHSFATLLLEEDVDIRYIQRMLVQLDNHDSDLYSRHIVKAKRDLKDQAPKKQNGFSVISDIYYYSTKNILCCEM